MGLLGWLRWQQGNAIVRHHAPHRNRPLQPTADIKTIAACAYLARARGQKDSESHDPALLPGDRSIVCAHPYTEGAGAAHSSVRTPCAVPSRQTWAFWCANTPTVTTPGHWFTWDSNASGSLICSPCTSKMCWPLSVTRGWPSFRRSCARPPIWAKRRAICSCAQVGLQGGLGGPFVTKRWGTV